MLALKPCVLIVSDLSSLKYKIFHSLGFFKSHFTRLVKDWSLYCNCRKAVAKVSYTQYFNVNPTEYNLYRLT